MLSVKIKCKPIDMCKFYSFFFLLFIAFIVNAQDDDICSDIYNDLTDSLGDMLVVMINIMIRNEISVKDCLRKALVEIQDRKGYNLDGVFVKTE